MGIVDRHINAQDAKALKLAAKMMVPSSVEDLSERILRHAKMSAKQVWDFNPVEPTTQWWEMRCHLTPARMPGSWQIGSTASCLIHRIPWIVGRFQCQRWLLWFRDHLVVKSTTCFWGISWESWEAKQRLFVQLRSANTNHRQLYNKTRYKHKQKRIVHICTYITDWINMVHTL